MFRKRDRRISKLKTKYRRRNQKFGIRTPNSVKEALQTNHETGTIFWDDDMKN
jgi:hypothetical protein